jgi:alkylation response protein AidB-like acyl-CoA dehydrogenase
LLVVAGTGDAAEVHLVPAGAWSAGAVRQRTGLRGLETVTGHLEASGERLGGGEPAARARADRLLGLAACAVGIGRRAVDECATYLAQRRQFGRPLARFGALRALLAESDEAVAAAAALVSRAADGELGACAAERARQAARVASRAAVRAADNAVQLHGGYGYIDEYVPERLLRDAVSVRALAGHRP